MLALSNPNFQRKGARGWEGGGGENTKTFFSENLRENRIYIQLLEVVWEQSHLAPILYFMSTVINLIEKLIENVFVVPHYSFIKEEVPSRTS